MQSLRQNRRIAQLVLLWFALFLGSAWAASLTHSSGLQWVCTGGAHMLLVDADEGPLQASPRMDCPLCAAVALPPVPLALHAAPIASPTLRSVPTTAPAFVGASAPPLPSRGPPLRS